MRNFVCLKEFGQGYNTRDINTPKRQKRMGVSVFMCDDVEKYRIKSSGIDGKIP